MRKINLSEIKANKYGRLKILSLAGFKDYGNKRRRTQVNCLCDCGNKVVLVFSHIKSGKNSSCGCLVREANTLRSLKHGMSKTTEYSSWSSMIRRCTNPKDNHFVKYGAKGISVCKRWMVFENFYKDMGKKTTQKHTLDRIKNDKGYYKKNCRWATPKEQTVNRGVTIFLEHKGLKLTLHEWSLKLNVKYQTLYRRYKCGWDISEILNKKLKK